MNHPGKILKEEYMIPLNLNSTKLAKFLNVSPSTINDIVLQRRGISDEIAVKLSYYFGNRSEYWVDLHLDFELKKIEQKKKNKSKILQELEKKMKKELSKLPSIKDILEIKSFKKLDANSIAV